MTSAQRQAAKAVNFGLIFGMGAAGLQQYAAQSYGVDMTLEEAKKFRDSFFNAYAGISWWHHDLKVGTFWEGRTLTGRKFLFSPRSGVADMANTPVQGTAADILKRALGLLFEEIVGRDWKIVGIVHDEILMEVPETEALEAAAHLKTVMERAGTVSYTHLDVYKRQEYGRYLQPLLPSDLKQLPAHLHRQLTARLQHKLSLIHI